MWNPENDQKVGRMMIGAVVLVFLLLAAVILGFVVLQKQHEKTISAATDTEGKTEIAIEIGKAGKGDGQETSEGETSGEDAVSDAAGTRENETGECLSDQGQ